MFDVIDTGSEPADIPVSEVVRAGNLVWSVHISEHPVTGELVLGDIETQTRRTLQNLEIAIRAAGGTLADVVQVQVFLVEKTDSAGMNKVYAEIFKDVKRLPPRPQWLSSEQRPVSSLPPVEIPRRSEAGLAASTTAPADGAEATEKAPSRRPAGQARPATA